MNWLNLEVKTRTAPQFVGSEPTKRATWLCLMLYSAEHETGGIIANVTDWGDRRWMQTCGVTKAEINTPSELWKTNDSDLILWGYPTEKENEVAAKREGGRKGGKKTQSKAPREAQLPSTHSSSPSNGKEGKGKERNEIGKEECAAHAHAYLNENVKSVCTARPEFNQLNQESIASILHNFQADPRFVQNLQEFICDAANALEPIKNPTAMLRAYLSRAPRKSKTTQTDYTL